MKAHLAIPARPLRTVGDYDRIFYTSMAVVMGLTVFAGFARTYYLRAFFDTPTFSGATELTPLMHLHGLVFTGWILLFIVQTGLIAAGRIRIHRRLGYASLVLATAMIVLGLRTAIAGAGRGSAPPGVDPVAFLAVPFFDMVLFAGFVAAAVLKRRDSEAHKRLMILAYVSIMAAGVARLPGVLPLGPPAFFGLAFLFAVAGMGYDRASRGRIHRVYVWGGAIFVLSVPLRLALSTTDAWRAFAAFLIR